MPAPLAGSYVTAASVLFKEPASKVIVSPAANVSPRTSPSSVPTFAIDTDLAPAAIVPEVVGLDKAGVTPVTWAVEVSIAAVDVAILQVSASIAASNCLHNSNVASVASPASK